VQPVPFVLNFFYLKNDKSEPEDIFSLPDQNCLDCPLNAICKSNTTLQTMGVIPNYWRDSLFTATLFKCNSPTVCIGLNTSDEIGSRRLSSASIDAPYCQKDHKGPRCEECVIHKQYFVQTEGKCIDCPPFSYENVIIIIAFLIVLVLFRAAAHRYEPLMDLITQTAVLVSNTGPEAKFKLLISFYQVITVLGPVYGVEFDERFLGYFKFLNNFNFNFFTEILPETCLGSMHTRLVVTVIWPLICIVIGWSIIYIHLQITRKMRTHETKHAGKNNELDLRTVLWGRMLKFTIIFVYIVLPPSARRIFDAIKCKSFQTNDAKSQTRSFVLSDLSLGCSADNPEYASVYRLFLAFLVLWPVLVPLIMFGLLWKIRHLVRAKRTTPLAEACSFLWRDYSEGFLYWEIFDIYRKLTLTGFILLIDPENGSTRILRLLIANVISMLYFGVLLLARPYKQANNLGFAFVSHILLMMCFILGTILHFCQDDTSCREFIGRRFTSYGATLLVVILTGSVLVITVLFLIYVAANAATSPSVRLVSTGSKPNLELPGECEFHAFFSHIWSTGKDKTHTAVRKMQLLLPGVRIWLDADELTHVDMLESSVNSCAVVLIFYTEGYFRSKNCRREVYAAVNADKPIYLLHEDGICDVEDIKEECARFCNEGTQNNSKKDKILQKVFEHDVIPWLGSGGSIFAIETIKLVSLAILRHLPFYVRDSTKLSHGLKIAGELGKVMFSSTVDLLVCEDNFGARRVAEEAKSNLPQKSSSINVLDAKLVLDEASRDFKTLLDGNTKYLLLYLDEDIFLDDDDEVSGLVRKALGLGIKILMIHELDFNRGACKFDIFFSQTPQDLIGALYKNIAVPLYPLSAYRQVSYRALLMHMGANKTGKQPSKNIFVASASLLLKTSLRNRRNPNTLSAARERWAES